MSTDTSWTRRAFQPCNKGAYMNDKRVFLTKRSPEYWRVTLNHPPLNIFGPKTIPQLSEIITAIETDKDLKVVVFDSAIDGFFMTHYDFLAPIEETTSLPPGQTGLQPLPDMLVRLSRAPVASIALIRGRATGVGSELALACDMRFASREKAILPPDYEIAPEWDVCFASIMRAPAQERIKKLMEQGFHKPGDVENRLGYHVGQVGR